MNFLIRELRNFPKAWHEIISIGTVDASGKFVLVADEIANDLIAGGIKLPPPVLISKPFSIPRKIKQVQLVQKNIPAIPRDQWPLAIKSMALLAVPEDKGIGDVAARTIEKLGGEKLKELYKTIFGHSCGCSDRQAALNNKFPLP